MSSRALGGRARCPCPVCTVPRPRVSALASVAFSDFDSSSDLSSCLFLSLTPDAGTEMQLRRDTGSQSLGSSSGSFVKYLLI